MSKRFSRPLAAALISSMAMAAAFTACSRAAPPEKPLLGLALRDSGDGLVAAIRGGFEAASTGKASLVVLDARGSQPEQTYQVDSLIQKKVQAIAMDLVDRASSDAIIARAKAAGVPLVFFDRRPTPEDMPKWDKIYFVGERPEEAGSFQGQIAAEWWKAHPEADRNRDGILQFVVLSGPPGDQDSVLRTQYMRRALDEAGIVSEKLAEDSAHWARAEGRDTMLSYIARFGDRVEFVLCNDDAMALGAIDALKSAGWFTGDAFMPVLGIGATKEGLAAVAEGSLLGTVKDDAEGLGIAVFELCLAMAKGRDAGSAGRPIVDNKYVWIEHRKVTRENLSAVLGKEADRN